MRVAIGRERETLDCGDRAKGGPRDLIDTEAFLSHTVICSLSKEQTSSIRVYVQLIVQSSSSPENPYNRYR